jgi:hypothetical protein
MVHGVELDATSATGWPQPEGGGSFRAPPSLADIDGDGHPEVLAVGEEVPGLVYVWRQNGQLFPGWPVEMPPLLTPGQGGNFVLAPPAGSDLDGDGIPEIIVADQGGLIAVYNRFGKPLEGWPQDISLLARTPYEFAVVPLGDGTSGVALGTRVTPGLPASLMLFDATGRMPPGWPQSLANYKVGGVAAGDLDDDGIPELVASDSQKIWAFHLDGSVVNGWPADGPVDTNHRQPLIADVSGDSVPDVVLLVSSFLGWGIFAWECDGTYLGALQPIRSGEETSQPPTLGDLDGDGLLDLTVAVEQVGSIRAPGKVYALGTAVDVDAASMHWPTHAHDYARTSTWTPPTQLFGGGGIVAPARLREDLSEAELAIHLDVPIEAPADADLEVTALDGLKIQPEPLQTTFGPEPAGDNRQALSGAVDAAAIMEKFEELENEHPELLLTDDEIRVWLDAGTAPDIPEGEIRALWLTVASPRIGVDKLEAHVPMELCRVMTPAGLTVYGVGGASCDNQPPLAVAQATTPVECSSPAGALVILEGSASSDPDSIAEPDDDIVSYEWFKDYGLPSQELLGTGLILDLVLPLGPHAITLRVEDLFGEVDTDEIPVQVVDTVPPAITVSLSPDTLWPPNHEMTDVSANVVATDECGLPVVVLVSVTSNEADDGVGDGNTVDDIQGVEPGALDIDFQLRAERAGGGNGRIYTATYRACDDAGNESSAAGTVEVPKELEGLPD